MGKISRITRAKLGFEDRSDTSLQFQPLQFPSEGQEQERAETGTDIGSSPWSASSILAMPHAELSDLTVDQVAAFEASLNARYGAGTQSDSIPAYVIEPLGESPDVLTLDYFISRIRYGNWTGGGFGSGRYSPNIDLSFENRGTLAQRIAEYENGAPLSPTNPNGSARLDPTAPYRDGFDRVARYHDLAYERAFMAEAHAIEAFVRDHPGASRAEFDAAAADCKATRVASIEQADLYYLTKTSETLTFDPLGMAVQELGRIALGLKADYEHAYNLEISAEQLIVGVGAQLGSRFGALIGSDNLFVTVGANTVGGLVGKEVGRLVHSFWDHSVLTAGGNGGLSLFDTMSNALSHNFSADLHAASASGFSELAHMLVAEATEDLGLNEFGTFVLNSATTSVTNFLYASLTDSAAQGNQLISILQGGMNFTSVVGFAASIAFRFVESEIGEEILDFAQSIISVDSETEGYFVTIGSIIGSVIGEGFGFLGTVLGKAVGEILGSFVFEALDFITGGWLGELFEPEPTGAIYIQFDEATQRLVVVREEFHADGYDRVQDLIDITRAMNDAYLSFVNGVIEGIGGRIDVSGYYPQRKYGYLNHATYSFHDGSFRVYRDGEGSHVASHDPSSLVPYGIAYELSKLIFHGGDLIQIRAINIWKRDFPGFEGVDALSTLAGYLSIAQDYRRYLENAETINLMIELAPKSPFALGWIATLAQAAALGFADGYAESVGHYEDGATGTALSDLISSADGDDILIGNAGADIIRAYGGNDIVYGGENADSIYGGTGRDLLLGDDGDDIVDAGSGDDTVYGGFGDDAIYGRRGNDLLAGDYGLDRLFGGDGDDQLFGFTGDDRLIGEAGNDQIGGENGHDFLDGGAGDDVLYGDSPNPVLIFVDPPGPGMEGLDIIAGDDTLIGGDGQDLARGGGGNDTISGDGDADRLYGDDGDDRIRGGSGGDRIFGGAGDDEIDGDADADRILGGGGRDRIAGGAGDDILLGLGDDDRIEGGSGADSLFGDAGDDILSGGEENDHLSGWSGADRISGDQGNDRLAGEDGNDLIFGGDGDDTLFGDRQPPPSQPGFGEQQVIDQTRALIGAGDFAIIYQGATYNYAGLAAADHDLIIINPAETVSTGEVNGEQLWLPESIQGIEDTGKQLIAYLNVAKINDFTDYWDAAWTSDGRAEGDLVTGVAPSFLSAEDPGYGHTRLVNFWETSWRDLLLARVETIIEQGFSGLFLDDVLEYFTRRGDSDAGRAQAAREMRDLVTDIATAAREMVEERQGADAASRFVIIVNGAPFLIDDTTYDGSVPNLDAADAFYASIDAFLAENYFSQDLGYAIDQAVAEYGSRGIALLSVDTDIATDQQRIDVEQAAVRAGFLPEVVANLEYDSDSDRFVPGFDDHPAPGNDLLDGGNGDDIIAGGFGNDNLWGGAGADIFVFDQIGDSRLTALRSDGVKFLPDRIGDFVSGEDRIDLSAIDAKAATGANDAFTFIGAAAFTGQAGQLRYDNAGGVMRIMGDVDGDGRADFEIVAVTPILQATDFIL